jgi:putative methionine-R-sulfoxide reductase with GAF domain
MSALEVPLETIMACFQGVIPSPFATCAPDGTPNITYLSIVRYVDPERVAVSRQFLNKTRANLDANPRAQVLVIDPETLQDYLLELRYLHTESDGPVFEEMRANLDAVASQSGMGDVFRLRGVDIHRVESCRASLGNVPEPPGERGVEPNTLRHLDELARRLAACRDYEEAARTALVALDDLLGFEHAVLLAAAGPDRLAAVVDHGFPPGWEGVEVPLGAGLIGVAAERRQVVAVANLSRNRSMRRGIERSAARRGESLAAEELPLPGDAEARSAAAVPLVVHGELTGALYLASGAEGRFGPHNERLLRIIAAHLSTTLAACARRPGQAAPAGAPPSPHPSAPPRVTVTYYQADDSLFVGDEYLVKGVPARILWKLLGQHSADGRTEFSNRELRLDESLGLPPGNDNLEARLLVLRRRLDDERWPLGLERVARGRLRLTVPGPLALVEVPTSGPMKAAHSPAPTHE